MISYKDKELKFGAYTRDGIFDLIKSNRIETLNNFKDEHVSVASIDLTVEDEVYEIERVLKPSRENNESIRDILKFMNTKSFNIGDTMYPGKSYIAKASVNLNFSPGVYMYANAKSSSGRNFLLVRVLCDKSPIFDGVDFGEYGYTGEVWLVFEPLAYPIVLSNKETYLQLRILNKDTRIGKEDLKNFLVYNDLLFNRDDLKPFRQKDLSKFLSGNSLLTTIYIPANNFIGYKVKKEINIGVDLTKRNLNGNEYFEKIYSSELFPGSAEGYFILKKDEKYLLSTNEIINLPINICAELKALDPRLGLFFSHFAGFFDPGFFGTATLEVIPLHDIMLRHGDPVARFEFEYLQENTISYADSKSNYNGQIDTKLPKQFSFN